MSEFRSTALEKEILGALALEPRLMTELASAIIFLRSALIIKDARDLNIVVDIVNNLRGTVRKAVWCLIDEGKVVFGNDLKLRKVP